MGITFNKAVDSATDGTIGVEILSGVRGSLLPEVSAQDRINGVTLFEKFYVTLTGLDASMYVGVDRLGIFNSSFFLSTGAAEVVGDLTGSEVRYGASNITKLIDSALAEETVNGAGSLIDIEKIWVEKNADFTFFRAADKIRVGVTSVTDQITAWEILLDQTINYAQLIDTFGFSLATVATLDGVADPYWLEVKVPSGSSTTSNFNSVGIATVY